MGFEDQRQDPPGTQSQMNPMPDCGETSYRGSGALTGKAAIITGGDSGIGRAVAIAYAREGAAVLISYLDEHQDAAEVAFHLVKAAVHHMPPGSSIIGSSSVNSDMPPRRPWRPTRPPKPRSPISRPAWRSSLVRRAFESIVLPRDQSGHRSYRRRCRPRR
jgi:hypothetical protein